MQLTVDKLYKTSLSTSFSCRVINSQCMKTQSTLLVMSGILPPTKAVAVFEDFLFKTDQIDKITVGKIELVIFSNHDHNTENSEIET